MAKSRYFSIYLLKEGRDSTNSLREDHTLNADVAAHHLPDDAVLFVLDSAPRPPWWKSYFGLEIDLFQASKGALVFMPVGGRVFALSFGHVSHNLVDTSYEYDFGLRVTLNSLDPQKLKSTDTLEPGVAKRQRTQLPTESELTLFDFDRESTILRSLTGKVKDEHSELFKHATGSSNLRVSTDVDADGLAALCEKLLTLYESKDYRASFPEIQNITPVKDPTEIEQLNANLLISFQARNPDLNLTVPELINYNDNVYAMFAGAGQSQIFDDVFIGRYYDYLDAHTVDLGAMTVDDLRKHALLLTDDQGSARDRFSIFKSLVFDTTLEGAVTETFHLCEGNWYRIDNDYIARMGAYLDPLFVASDLPDFGHDSEGAYNEAVPITDLASVCLDTQSIAPAGMTAVEPCDLLAIRGEQAVFYHVKISTLSAQLSHLFNQGLNAIELIRLEQQALDRLVALVQDLGAGRDPERLIDLIEQRNYRLVYGIVTRKDAAGLSANLPLFSRITLMRSLKEFQLMGVPASVMFIRDTTVAAAGKKKPRRKKPEADALAEAAE
ncbi:DUF6119 family protein [Bosea sp. (in: a-proteobacteria)]|jgi:uncharacterized protein (TIGR04141 family)|uniref:DUF6119 family protein n=1 Tax=Bosea sp. (in: a-proteobacteria) TaxID=1871050 RepID=UPI0035623E9D